MHSRIAPDQTLFLLRRQPSAGFISSGQRRHLPVRPLLRSQAGERSNCGIGEFIAAGAVVSGAQRIQIRPVPQSLHRLGCRARTVLDPFQSLFIARIVLDLRDPLLQAVLVQAVGGTVRRFQRQLTQRNGRRHVIRQLPAAVLAGREVVIARLGIEETLDLIVGGADGARLEGGIGIFVPQGNDVLRVSLHELIPILAERVRHQLAAQYRPVLFDAADYRQLGVAQIDVLQLLILLLVGQEGVIAAGCDLQMPDRSHGRDLVLQIGLVYVCAFRIRLHAPDELHRLGSVRFIAHRRKVLGGCLQFPRIPDLSLDGVHEDLVLTQRVLRLFDLFLIHVGVRFEIVSVGVADVGQSSETDKFVFRLRLFLRRIVAIGEFADPRRLHIHHVSDAAAGKLVHLFHNVVIRPVSREQFHQL